MDDQDEHVLGVLILDSAYVETLPRAFSPMLEAIAYSLICLLVVAGAIGTIFGYVTARGLTRRLKSLTTASDSWSQGQFTVFVEDRSADEIGQLAARLNRMAQQLQNLLDTRRELAVVEERNRLARDLHDSAKQQAFAASAQIAAAKAVIGQDPGAAEKHLAEAETLVNALRKELGVLITELRPAALGDRGLAAALAGYASEWSRQSGISSAVRLQGEHALPLDVEQTLYRITQEALANVARHSGASKVDLWLGYAPDAITLTITDDGGGFEPGQKTGGVGLSSMRERAQAVGGSLEVTSAPAGTIITARCPLNQPFNPEESL
jgi:NarL family two-component system sensor histidine kinase LiaS